MQYQVQLSVITQFSILTYWTTFSPKEVTDEIVQQFNHSQLSFNFIDHMGARVYIPKAVKANTIIEVTQRPCVEDIPETVVV